MSYNRYIVAVGLIPSSPVHTQSSGPCPGCSGCSDCKKKEFPVHSFSDTTNPGTLNNDLPQPLTVQSQETKTTDTNEKEFRKGDICFYKSNDGHYEEATIESVTNGSNPVSYVIKFIPKHRETTAERLFKTVPDDGEVSDGGVLQEHQLHKTQYNPVIQQNEGPWRRSQEQVKNESQKLFGDTSNYKVKYDALRSEGAGHSHGVSKLNFVGERGQKHKKKSSSSGRTRKHTQNNTDVVEPVYPEADYSCMSFNNLY